MEYIEAPFFDCPIFVRLAYTQIFQAFLLCPPITWDMGASLALRDKVFSVILYSRDMLPLIEATRVTLTFIDSIPFAL